MDNTANTSRFNIYNFPHKGLRALMGDTLLRVGRADWADANDVAPTLDQVRFMMDIFAGHLHHENEFVHAAMEARRPGSALHTAADHVEHVEAIESLRAAADEIEAAAPAARGPLAHRLYTRLALFIAENLEHMATEEIDNNAVLWACYTDEEIMGIEQRLLAAIPPQKAAAFLRWMIPAMNAGERAQLLGGARQAMPPEAFEGLLANLRPLLGAADWRKLEGALGLAVA